MNESKNPAPPPHLQIWTFIRQWLFPASIGGLYILGSIFAPQNTWRAIHMSIEMFAQLALPICLVLVMMVLLNRYLTPATVTKFLGQRAGLKGIFLSSIAGMISMGPIYAWYPLLKTMKEKGTSPFHLANFIGNRSIKPVLLPVLTAYWGYRFAAVFVLVSLAGALLTAFITSMFCPNFSGPKRKYDKHPRGKN